jgi:hypothetical protein
MWGGKCEEKKSEKKNEKKKKKSEGKIGGLGVAIYNYIY